MAVPQAASAEPLKILALGDSLTSGYGLPPGAGFTDQLGQAVVHVGGRQQAEADVMVFAVAGSVSSGGSSNHDQTTTMKRRRTARTRP